jgi:hypothetical protein
MSVGLEAREVGFVAWGGHTVATLRADGSWRVLVDGADDPATVRNLAALYADTYGGPADGHYGQAILPALADLMGGVWWFHQPPPAAFDEIN